MKKIFLSVILGMFVLSMVSAYDVTYASFDGKWENGAVLMSDYYHINDALVFAKNSYSIGSGSRVKVCETVYTEMKKRVCQYLIIGYRDKTRTVCMIINKKRVCQVETYQVPIKKQVCVYEIYQKPKTVCKYIGQSASASCTNPSGESTNALSSDNFEYQRKGESTWRELPKNGEDWNYAMQNVDIRFRVTIPEVCYPEYNINKSVVIQER